MTSPDPTTSLGRIRGLMTLRVDSSNWQLLNEGHQAPVGGLNDGHYSVYASADHATELHLVAWPIDNHQTLRALLTPWGGGVDIIHVQGTTIGYRSAGGGLPPVAWWTDDRGYLVMASVNTPIDSLELRRALVEGPSN